MKTTNERILRYGRRGICSACDHVATCRLHLESEGTIFFCEEFSGISDGSIPEKRRTFSAPERDECEIALKKPECARLAYLGLCRNCKKITTCPFLKPGGGTWQCEEYEARTGI